MSLKLHPFWGACLVLASSTALAASHGDDPSPLARSAAIDGSADALGIVWDARAVEHLYSRAGFGASRREIDRGVKKGVSALVDELLNERYEEDPFFYERMGIDDAERMRDLEREERRKLIRERNRADRLQMQAFSAWWIDRMIEGHDPLRERMTLFWHGFFTSSYKEVGRSDEMIAQNDLFREHGLGSYRALVHGIVRDPAMLRYLDNDKNRKQAPNENLARELMELFTLGEGNYTEEDVKEAARALTGHRANRQGEFDVRWRAKDRGPKTILGVEGRHDAKTLVEILLDQPACARWVTTKLLTYFEGYPPTEERLASYAQTLRDADYELKPFLRRLFLDPYFYSDEIVGARVLSPIDFLIGTSRRLDIDAPPAFVGQAASVLGQRLFDPPSVKGWDEGETWITTSTLLQRGNFAGMMLGVVDLDDLLADAQGDMEPEDSMMDADMMSEEMAGEAMSSEDSELAQRSRQAVRAEFAGKLRELQRFAPGGWRPNINLSARCVRAGHETDVEIVDFLLDELLVGHARGSARDLMIEFLSTHREELGLADGALFESWVEAEKLLRRLSHLILSLPEAQLG